MPVEQGVWQAARMPPVTGLFRQPLLREVRETGLGFRALARHGVSHEAGHDFEVSDAHMHALEDMVSG